MRRVCGRDCERDTGWACIRGYCVALIMQRTTAVQIRAMKTVDAFDRVLPRINAEPKEIDATGDLGFAWKAGNAVCLFFVCLRYVGGLPLLPAELFVHEVVHTGGWLEFENIVRKLNCPRG